MLNQKLTGQQAAEKTYIEDVFSTYLYTGNGSTQTINNGIDLAGKGGMVWFKSRTAAEHNALIDTARGNTKVLISNTTGANNTDSSAITSFDSAGFSLGAGALGFTNNSAQNFASWTFRKAPKFFDVVTYTGDGTNGREIAHSLGQVPGMIIVKRTNSTSNWYTWHRSISTSGGGVLLNATVGWNVNQWSASDQPSSSAFKVSSTYASNVSGATYVAYLFAHDTTTDGLIQCGSFTTDSAGSTTSPVNLGCEPQYIMLKRTTGNGYWEVWDTMRGMSMTSTARLYPNVSNAEDSYDMCDISATGFSCTGSMAGDSTYIYMAIRRGPMRTPTDGTKVFAPLVVTESTSAPYANNFSSGFVTDSVIEKFRSGSNTLMFNRLLGGNYLVANSTSSEFSDTTSNWSSMTGGTVIGTTGSSGSNALYAFKRAPGFFDVVCYTGTGAARTVNHNLGVAPELMIVKRRDAGYDWGVWHKSIGNDGLLILNTTDTVFTSNNYWNNTAPTSTVFSAANSGFTNASGSTYVAYLFASCPGVSKVGSYTGTGAQLDIDCGFTNGARFVMIKRTDNIGDWWVMDTARGITAGADPRIRLNSTSAEGTVTDMVDPYASGFSVTTTNSTAGATYIYLAIA